MLLFSGKTFTVNKLPVARHRHGLAAVTSNEKYSWTIHYWFFENSIFEIVFDGFGNNPRLVYKMFSEFFIKKLISFLVLNKKICRSVKNPQREVSNFFAPHEFALLQYEFILVPPAHNLSLSAST